MAKQTNEKPFSGKIEAQITIMAMYDDLIYVTIYDKNAGARFVEMELTREQFINAVMNRLAMTEVKKTRVCNLDKVGKKIEYKPFTFEIPERGSAEAARKAVLAVCPLGYIPDMDFASQDTFSEKDGKFYAKTIIRRWRGD